MNHSSLGTGFTRLTDFLTQLDQHKIHYHLAHHQDDAITVATAIPGERWEIMFFPDGQIEVERFVSQGNIEGEEALDSLFIAYTNEPPPSHPVALHG